MYGVNIVILAGRVGRVDIHSFQDGSKVANVSLATTTRGYTTKSGAEIKERTEWHNLVLRGGLSTLAEKYIGKGSQIHVKGELRYREYDSNGQKRYITEVVCEDVQLLDSSQKKQEEASPEPEPEPEPEPAQEATASQSATEGSGDPLPF